jgi:hypothetical protein
MLIIGCDFHTRYQQIAMAEEATGELLLERRLDHENGEAHAFYRNFHAPVRVGIEATGLNAPVTPLKSALTSPSQLTENKATLSPAESALTSISPATSLESALTKNMGGGGLSFRFWNEFTPSEAEGLLHTRYATQVLSFHILAHSFALFCAQAKLNSFLFNRFRTLCPKHQGWGGVVLTR